MLDDEGQTLGVWNLSKVEIEDDPLMAKISFTVTNVCSGGNHLTVSANSNGGAPVTFVVDTNELQTPIPAEELPTIVKFLMRNYADGKAISEARSGLQAGVTVNI